MSSPLFLKSSISHAKSFTVRSSVCSCVCTVCLSASVTLSVRVSLPVSLRGQWLLVYFVVRFTRGLVSIWNLGGLLEDYIHVQSFRIRPILVVAFVAADAASLTTSLDAAWLPSAFGGWFRCISTGRWCRQLCSGKCCTGHDSWAVGFAATNKNIYIITKLAVGNTELHCPEGSFLFFHFWEKH